MTHTGIGILLLAGVFFFCAGCDLFAEPAGGANLPGERPTHLGAVDGYVNDCRLCQCTSKVECVPEKSGYETRQVSATGPFTVVCRDADDDDPPDIQGIYLADGAEVIDPDDAVDPRTCEDVYPEVQELYAPGVKIESTFEFKDFDAAAGAITVVERFTGADLCQWCSELIEEGEGAGGCANIETVTLERDLEIVSEGAMITGVRNSFAIYHYGPRTVLADRMFDDTCEPIACTTDVDCGDGVCVDGGCYMGYCTHYSSFIFTGSLRSPDDDPYLAVKSNLYVWDIEGGAPVCNNILPGRAYRWRGDLISTP